MSQLDFSLFPYMGISPGIPKESTFFVKLYFLLVILRKGYEFSMVQYNIEYFMYTVLY